MSGNPIITSTFKSSIIRSFVLNDLCLKLRLMHGIITSTITKLSDIHADPSAREPQQCSNSICGDRSRHMSRTRREITEHMLQHESSNISTVRILSNFACMVSKEFPKRTLRRRRGSCRLSRLDVEL